MLADLDETLQGDPGALLIDMGDRLWSYLHGVPGCGGHDFKKALVEVAQWNYFGFYVIVKIIIMATHLQLDVCRNVEYFQMITVYLYHKGVYG